MLVKSNKRTNAAVVIRVWLQEEAAHHVDAVAAWVAKAVSLAHPSGPHPVIAGTLYNNFEANDLVHNCIEAAVKYGCPHPDIVSQSVFDDDDLVVLTEGTPTNGTLSADAIALQLQETELPVLAVGVSAVSLQYAAEVWDEVVEPLRTWMDGCGEGKRVHRQFMYTRDHGSWCVPEGTMPC